MSIIGRALGFFGSDLPKVYATLDASNKASSITLSGSDLIFTCSAGGGGVRSTIGKSAGKWSCEVTGMSATVMAIGIFNSSYTGTDNIFAANADVYYGNNGSKYLEGTNSAYGAAYSANTMRLELDMDAGELVAFKDNVSQGVLVSGLTGTWYFGFGAGSSVGGGTVNFGATAFVNAPTAGFNTGMYN